MHLVPFVIEACALRRCVLLDAMVQQAALLPWEVLRFTVEGFGLRVCYHYLGFGKVHCSFNF